VSTLQTDIIAHLRENPEGLTRAQLADRLFTTPGSVKVHICHLRKAGHKISTAGYPRQGPRSVPHHYVLEDAQ
jgi:hypothetical protein